MLRSGILAVLASLSLAADGSAREPRSSLEDLSPSLREMQEEPSLNPGFLWVLEGEALWSEPSGASGRSCASCHGEPTSMRGVAARYPAWDEHAGAPITLSGRIEQCRTERQGAASVSPDTGPLLALSALVGQQSRGRPMRPPEDGRLAAARARGEALFRTRMGQLDLSCAQCHEERAGMRLGSAVIPEGHANAYPQYRLEWQELGALSRRLRNCMTGVRAEPFPPGSAELVELELYLAARAAGLPVETPGVRP